MRLPILFLARPRTVKLALTRPTLHHQYPGLRYALTSGVFYLGHLFERGFCDVIGKAAATGRWGFLELSDLFAHGVAEFKEAFITR